MSTKPNLTRHLKVCKVKKVSVEIDVIRTLIDDYESTLTDYASEKNPKYNEKIKVIKQRDSEEKVYDDLHTEVKRSEN